MGQVLRVAAVLVVLAVVGGVAWLAMPRANPAPAPDTLSGTVEWRRIDLAFSEDGSVRGMAKREGDAVHEGEQVAELDDAFYINAQTLAVARGDAAKAKLDVLLAGTRPEQIDRDRAMVAGAQATLVRAEATFTRQEDLLNRKVVSQQAYDDALMVRDSARAAVSQYQSLLAEAVAGPRPKEIEAARAELRVAEASVRLAEGQLAQTKLRAPVNGVVTVRAIEPGIAVRAGAPVYTVAIVGQATVRAFAPEAILFRIAPNTQVAITGGGHTWRGRIGAVSAAADYGLRIDVENPDASLRQGMPVTITLPGTLPGTLPSASIPKAG